jgi:exonuclease III
LGQVSFQNEYVMSIDFVFTLSGAEWTLTNIYAPYTQEGRHQFLDWFNKVDMQEDTDWLIVGDFNLIGKQSDINKPVGNPQDMLKFNMAISNLILEELRLHGNRYNWSNKQVSPLLERLDWFLASVS